MILQKLHKKNLIHPPTWLPDNTHYLCLMGSVAYGCSSDTSDNDIYGFCIPNKEDIFPHLRGEIPGFGRQVNRFENWQEHHIKDTDEDKEYDFSIFSIIRFFHLCMENNPNMIDSLFVPLNCIIHSTKIGNRVRANRQIFLHKGAYHRFRGYAASQLHKMRTKSPDKGSNRRKIVEKLGWDVKYGYHLVRLLNECEQILQTGDLDLQRDKEYLKAIRRGEVSQEQIYEYFESKEKYLEELYQNSDLPYKPDEEQIKNMLLECLEMHFGDLSKCVVVEDKAVRALREISKVIEKFSKDIDI